MPGERLGRLEGEGEEWQLGACPSYGRWASLLALVMGGGPAPHLGLLGGWWAVAAHPTSLRIPTCSSVFIRNKEEGYGSGQSYLHGGQVGDAVHC